MPLITISARRSHVPQSHHRAIIAMIVYIDILLCMHVCTINNIQSNNISSDFIKIMCTIVAMCFPAHMHCMILDQCGQAGIKAVHDHNSWHPKDVAS